MSDIVEILRNEEKACLYGEAFREIGVLLKGAADHIERAMQGEKAADAEIERLREELLARHNELRAKAEEIERLRSLLREWLDGTALLTLTGSREFAARVREALGDVPDA